MTLTVTNALTLSAAPVPDSDALSSTAPGVTRQHFASVINQLLAVQESESALNTLSQPLAFTLTSPQSSGSATLLSRDSGAELPLPGEAGGNELPYLALGGALPLSEVPTNSIDISSSNVSPDALATFPISADGISAENPLHPSLLVTAGLARMQTRVDGDGDFNSALMLSDSTLPSGGRILPGTASPVTQLMAERSNGDASIVNPLNAIISTALTASGSTSPVTDSTVATLEVLLSQQQARSLTPAPDMLAPQPGNSLNATALSPSANAVAPAALIDTLPVPPRHAQFDSELGHRLVWMTKNNVSFAEIRMNPPHLGPIEIRVTVSQDQASVWMNAHHSVTRDALEQTIPRLREMLQDAGLTLSDTNISSNSNSSQQQGKGFSPFAQQVLDGDIDAHSLLETEILDGTESQLNGKGVIDYFA